MLAIAIQNLVRRLLTLEAAEKVAAENSDQDSVIGAAARVLDKLRVHLSHRIGQEGFRTLLARALTLATSQFPHLSAVRVGADGSLVGLNGAVGSGSQETPARVTQQDAVEGAVALVAHLLGLLITFIGEELTLRILSAVSPGLALPEIALPGIALDDATGGENERP